jgi:hypothetical protein
MQQSISYPANHPKMPTEPTSSSLRTVTGNLLSREGPCFARQPVHGNTDTRRLVESSLGRPSYVW